MQESYFSGCINVEMIGEQCSLTTTTHRKIGEMSDGTGTQVKVQIINKCKVLMTSRRLYKRRGSP